MATPMTTLKTVAPKTSSAETHMREAISSLTLLPTMPLPQSQWKRTPLSHLHHRVSSGVSGLRFIGSSVAMICRCGSGGLRPM